MNENIRPWLNIWIRPKDTIREILDVPSKWPLFLALLYGVIYQLDHMSSRNWGDTTPLFFIFLAALVFGPVIGFIGWYVSSGIIYGIARLFGGVGEWKETRIAMAWCAIPFIVKGALWFPFLLFFGREMFTSTNTLITSHLLFALIFVVLSVLEIVFIIWFLVALSNGIGEVHGFSAWKGFLSIIIVPVTYFLFLFILGAILVAL